MFKDCSEKKKAWFVPQGDEDDDYDEEEGDGGDAATREKISGILQQVPELFELEKDLEEILKLVLDQELQKYNLLISTMVETLQAALNVIDGKSLVTNDIEDFIDAIVGGEIPEPWQDVAYPTMEDLDGFLADLKERTDFLRDWKVNGPPK